MALSVQMEDARTSFGSFLYVRMGGQLVANGLVTLDPRFMREGGGGYLWVASAKSALPIMGFKMVMLGFPIMIVPNTCTRSTPTVRLMYTHIIVQAQQVIIVYQ